MRYLAFNEDTRVKIPATIQFLKIGYGYQSLKDENLDIDFATKIFVNRFKPAIEKINDVKLTIDDTKELLDEINNLIKNNDLGKAFYSRLINPRDDLKLIDFDNIDNNDFAVVDELPFSIKANTEAGSFRPDVNILVNGMPLAFLEVKKPNNDGGIQREFSRMINQRLETPEFRKYFNLIQIVSFSNNMDYEESDEAEDVRAGSFYTTPNGNNTSFSFFREDDKRYNVDYQYRNVSAETIKSVTKDLDYSPKNCDTPEFVENLSNTRPCNSFITSLFDKERLLYILHYGILYVNGKVPQKQIMRYPQFFATRKIIERLDSGGKGGIIWHTQGSGKTALAAYSNRIIRDYYAKKGIVARFFFVVDRIDLMRQSSSEFQNRGFSVVNCGSRSEFASELSKSLVTQNLGGSIGEFCVVNIQKFMEEMPQAKNDYDAHIQRVFFVDEAHRSYRRNGEYFKNLMTCDRGGVFIALTGTPLLSQKERSNLKFGDYIHKYFYDKSIADGYTLRIKKEDINTTAKKDIKENLSIEDGNLDQKQVYESDAYVSALGKFIEVDFKNFRFVNSDKSIGGMIVCRSNQQAKKIHHWFVDNSDLSTGLVITDDSDPLQSRANKENQTSFRNDTVPDLLVVNMMLTTGYDAKRLKKMYLLRGPRAQNLLQTISRVNRPYKSPAGKLYRYGYVVDFVDIEKEYDETIEAYIKELEEDMNDADGEQCSLSGLVVGVEDIEKNYRKYLDELAQIVNINGSYEDFTRQLGYLNKEALLRIRRLLNNIKDCETEFELSDDKHESYIAKEEKQRYSQLRKLVKERLDFINLSCNAVEAMNFLSDDEVVSIIYEFVKTKGRELDLGDLNTRSDPRLQEFVSMATAVQREIKLNKNRDSAQIKRLDELLEEVFSKLKITDLDHVDELTLQLKEALDEARAINRHNEELASLYGGNFTFVKTYQDMIADYELDEPTSRRMLKIIYDEIGDSYDKDIYLIQGRRNFIDTIKKRVTIKLLKDGIFGQIKDCYEQVLGDLYKNTQLY